MSDGLSVVVVVVMAPLAALAAAASSLSSACMCVFSGGGGGGSDDGNGGPGMEYWCLGVGKGVCGRAWSVCLAREIIDWFVLPRLY